MNPLETILLNNTQDAVTELSFAKLKHEFEAIPDEIFELKMLRTLNLADIPIRRQEILKITSFEYLEELVIRNYVDDDFPLELIELTKLRSLTLAHSNIRLLPEALISWTKLSYLNLTYSNFLSVIKGLPPNLTYLNIGYTSISSISPQIYNLKRLIKLVANGLGFKRIPVEIFKILSLESLFLSGNELTSVPKEICDLVDLEELYLIDNRFKTIPNNITNLKRLTILNLRDNFIRLIPESVSNLMSLKEIDLSNNCLIEFPTALLKLNIESIFLGNASYNKREIRNSIKFLPPEIINCSTLSEFEIAGNPIENVPEVIVSRSLKAIKNFFLSKIEADNEEFLFEAKMVIVGRGNVGKSVLTQKLTNPNYELGDSDSTTGINILKSPFLANLTINGSNVNFKLNIWDFGGQEKYDATHQLFITKRSIYLFLTEAREESNYLDFYYWLNTIQLFSDNSPVIIVLSKIDERKKMLPESLYKEKFDNIVEFVDVSCAKGYEYSIDHLKVTLNKAIGLLPQTKLRLSNRWIDVRNELESLALSKDYISYKEYLVLCSQHKLDKERADFLSHYLNDLGVIVHHQFDLLLKETVFINTDWCVDGMYKVLDSDAVINGKFTEADIAALWDETRFSDKKYELLKLMYQYHLCFELKDGSGFIAPDLLPPDKPREITWDQWLNLRFEYQYDFMPAGILSRFIVKAHNLIKDEIYWKHGVVLDYEGTLALVEEDYIYNKIKISLKGKEKKALLTAVRLFIKEVHKDFDKASKLIFEEMVPCNCTECTQSIAPHFFRFNTLKKFEDKGKRTIACEISSDDVLIKSLIDDIQVSNKVGSFTTSQDLKNFITDIIDNILTKEIKFKSSWMNFWRDSNVPKNETEVQPYISNTLDNYCKINGIQLSRETKEAEGNVDILFTTRNDENELLKVCLEIKKAHHNDVETAIKTQLPLYMESSNTEAGIYLVIWLKTKDHPLPKEINSIDELNNRIIANNPFPNNISIKIIDCCKPVNPSKVK